MSDKKHIKETISNFLYNKEEILFAYIFGSFVNKEYYHDIDIAVFLNDEFDKDNFVKFPYGYESDITANLNLILRNDIDFVVINNSEILLQKRIIENGELIFSKDEKKRIYFENYIRKLYIDSTYLRKIKRLYLSEKIKNAWFRNNRKKDSCFYWRPSKYQNITVSEIKNDKDILWILERGIYLLIQNLFDIFAHIVSADFNEKWDFYSDISDILVKHNLITVEDKVLLNQMAGFRNRLSHEYLSLELNVLLDITNNRLTDFSKFLLIIKNYCKL